MGSRRRQKGRNYHSLSNPTALTVSFFFITLQWHLISSQPAASLSVGKGYQTNSRHFKLNHSFAGKPWKIIKMSGPSTSTLEPAAVSPVGELNHRVWHRSCGHIFVMVLVTHTLTVSACVSHFHRLTFSPCSICSLDNNHQDPHSWLVCGCCSGFN